MYMDQCFYLTCIKINDFLHVSALKHTINQGDRSLYLHCTDEKVEAQGPKVILPMSPSR